MQNEPNALPNLTTVDIFCGCGGLSLGFREAGFTMIAAYDNWDLACATYRKNFDHDAHLLDLSRTEYAAEHIRRYAPNVIIGGPPCQDFSIAGKRIEAQRASLTVAFAKIVSIVLPQIVVMENVYNIEKSTSLGLARQILSDAGYGITCTIVDASLTGVPQKRKRFFLIGMRGVPDNAFAENLEANLAKKPMTVHDYFGDNLGINHYYAHPRSYKRRAVFSIHEPSSTIRRVNRPIPKNYALHPADKAIISNDVRTLTTKERAGIQTFPDDFVFCGSKSQQEHLLANAVPVRLAQYVAEQIIQVLRTRGYNNLRTDDHDATSHNQVPGSQMHVQSSNRGF